MTRGLVAAALLCSAIACAPATTIDTAADEAAIAALGDREISFFSSGNIDSGLAIITADAVVMPPNEPMLVGTEAIRTWASAMLSQVTMSGRYTERDISVAGDWAVERYVGELSATPKAGGPTTTEKIKGIHVYQRQADGTWKIAQDVWNTDTPVPPPPPSK